MYIEIEKNCLNALEIDANVKRLKNLPWHYFQGILLDHHDVAWVDQHSSEMMLNHPVYDIVQVSYYGETYLQTIRVPFLSKQTSMEEDILVEFVGQI